MIENYKNLLYIMSQASVNCIECDEDRKHNILTLIKFYPEIIREGRIEYEMTFEDKNWNWIKANEFTNYLDLDDFFKEDDIHEDFRENILSIIKEYSDYKLDVDFEIKPDRFNPYYLKISESYENAFTINEIETENDLMYLKKDLILILFNQQHRGVVHNMLKIIIKYPNVNFLFKPYLNNSEISLFSNVIKENDSPVLLHKTKRKTFLLSTGIISFTKLNKLIANTFK